MAEAAAELDAEEKNRYVLERVARRLDREDDFHGRIVLECRDGEIYRHLVRRSFLTDDLLEEDGGRC